MAKLTKTELLQMDNNIANQQLIEKDKEILSHKKTIEMLTNKLRNLESSKNVELINKTIDQKNKQVNDLKEENREFNEKIKKKYKIKGAFGVNPDTGEIV